jgi:HEPN domain-containing protein
MRRSPLDEGRRWLEQAEEDLRWAKHLARRGGYHIACFLAQQVGEKAPKAFLMPRVRKSSWVTRSSGCAGTPPGGNPD